MQLCTQLAYHDRKYHRNIYLKLKVVVRIYRKLPVKIPYDNKTVIPFGFDLATLLFLCNDFSSRPLLTIIGQLGGHFLKRLKCSGCIVFTSHRSKHSATELRRASVFKTGVPLSERA